MLHTVIRISDWPFPIKLAIAPLVSIAMMISVALISLGALTTQSATMDRVLVRSSDGNMLLQEASDGIQSVNGNLYRILALQAAGTKGLDVATEIGRLDSRLDQVQQRLSQYRDRFARSDQRDRLDGLVQDVAKYRKALTFVSQMMEIDFNSAVSFLVPFDQNSQVLIAALSELVRMGNAASRIDAEAADAVSAKARQSAISLTAGVIVALVVLTSTIVTTTVRSIRTIARRTEELANGNVSDNIRNLARRDELGVLVNSLEVFRTNLLQVDQLRAEQETTKREAEGKRRSDLVALADTFERSVHSVASGIASAAGDMRVSSKMLSDTTRKASDEAEVVSQASIQATQNVHSVASAAQELSASVREITQQVSASSIAAEKAVTEAGESMRSVTELSEMAEKIGTIVSLITDIASRTNLLALNATIEAARAGDAGKGFAVVATEVKNLASQTARATGEIATQIQEIQGATRGTVAAIDSITRTIRSLNEISIAIAAAVEQQGAATEEISRVAEQVAAATETVSKRITGVSAAAKEAGRESESVLSASSNLARQSDVLNTEVANFLTTIRQS
ncbi:MAG: HAMP domain-containing protein [Telmatospirillum sp.]|nr:HAMP domain-containing protein [Telmatospirillum sp.]